MESARSSFSKNPGTGASDLHSLARQLSLAIVKGDNGSVSAADQDDIARQAARATLETVEQAAQAFRTSESHIRAIAQRAIDELAVAQDRIRSLEGRVLKAETRAREAEKWLLRLHESVRETLAEWRSEDGVNESSSYSSAA